TMNVTPCQLAQRSTCPLLHIAPVSRLIRLILTLLLGQRFTVSSALRGHGHVVAKSHCDYGLIHGLILHGQCRCFARASPGRCAQREKASPLSLALPLASLHVSAAAAPCRRAHRTIPNRQGPRQPAGHALCDDE